MDKSKALKIGDKVYVRRNGVKNETMGVVKGFDKKGWLIVQKINTGKFLTPRRPDELKLI